MKMKVLGGLAVVALAAYGYGVSGCTTTGKKNNTNTATAMPTATATNSPTNTPTPTFTPWFTPVGTVVSFLIVSGGYGSSGRTASTYLAPVYANGNIGTFVQATPLPTAVGYQSMGYGTAGGSLYIAEGDTGVFTGTSNTSTYIGAIGAGGAITGWATSTPMPTPDSYSGYANYANTLFVVGGANYNNSAAGAYSGGNFTTWVQGSPIPTPVNENYVAVSGTTIFSIGGYAGAAVSTVYSASLTGSAWTSVTPALPIAISDGRAFSIPGYVFVVGGYAGGNQTTIYSNTVNGSGALGASWTTTAMPRAAGDFGMAVVPSSFNGYVYSIGGFTSGASGNQSTIYYAPFNGTVLWSWTSTTALPVPLLQAAVAPSI